MKGKIIVVGNGMVGYKFCEKIVELGLQKDYEVIVFGEEPRPAYDRIHLSSYFDGTPADDLTLASKAWYAEHDITLHCGLLVASIDRTDKTIRTHTGIEFSYDYLVLATGSHPFVPPIPGVEKKGVFVYRTIEDLENIESYAKKLKAEGHFSAAVLGGGLLGLEAAKALKDMDFDTHVVEMAPRLMCRQLDDPGAELLCSEIEEMGIQVHLNKLTQQIEGEDRIEGISFSEGSDLKVQMLLVSAGIKPRDEIARSCGLQVGPRGGIVVNRQMETSDPAIYAIGEVALYNEMIYGLAAPGYQMAEVALQQIIGEPAEMVEEIDMSTKLKLMGIDVASFGDPFVENVPHRKIVYNNKYAGIYKRINVTADGTKLLGGMLVGDAADYNMLLQYVQNEMLLPENPEDLILPARDGAATGPSALDLPDTAVICACENVTKGAIVDAVETGGCSSFKEVSACTKAAGGCAGCKPMVVELINGAMSAMGKTVNNDICEHFPYERHELHDLIRVKGYRSYDEVLDAEGKGDGCEICKPALASLFATIYNETANRQEGIQDTNDRYLANIQRNGSYSVVPRIPGGEITPEKLIVIGQVAQKYDLYTKITGGQRIDLFGARLEELPLIWEELIAAGFESGHAYGKSLRTVKSCVGSTWCRYGMDESVSFAIELENRYKGIRSPHKFKGGVSGCIRECAEARCKDFGLIATEAGWNLYVCGNGGASPKHAVLLVESIDNITCIKYLDRFIMFYLKTAQPLMRTAAWLEKLEGGIEYLRKVVIDDVLGIGEELETQLKFMVSSYQCEWKQAVEDPDIRKRFSHFINSDAGDEELAFVEMRDQKMPIPWK